MKYPAIFATATLMLALVGSAAAQSGSNMPNNSSSPAKEADKMRSGDKVGSAPNSSNPGASSGAEGNATQDSRTTKSKDR